MKSLSRYTTAILLVITATIIGEAVRLHISPINMVMLYLLTVVLASLKLGLRPAIVTALFGVLAFDIFFVPPRFSLTVADKEYLITFLGLFTVGVVISTLVSKLRERAEKLQEREAETALLYHLSRDIASAADNPSVFKAVEKHARECFATSVALLLPTTDGLASVIRSERFELTEQGWKAAYWSLKSLRKSGQGTHSFPDAGVVCIPLVIMGECIAILILEQIAADDHRFSRIIEGFAVQLKMVLARIELAKQTEVTQILQAQETLERALLNSISHDLRTPLVTVTGVLTTLKNEETRLNGEVRRELLDTACTEAERLNRFVGNLLDMTRIESGAIRLNRELYDVQELIGCALAAIEQRTGNRSIEVTISDGLPLIPMDLVLMTQVLVNLLDNAHKHAPDGSCIEVRAFGDTCWLTIEVADHGSGVDNNDLQRIFDKFYRIPIPEGAGGTGLGLSICKGIVEAHDGTIQAKNRSTGGLSIIIRLPINVFHDNNSKDKP